MKKKSLVGQIFLILTLLCPLSFGITLLVGDVAYFEIAGMLKYAWIMLIFLVIPIATIVITIILEMRGYRHFENYLISAFMAIILLACGSFSFVYKDYYSYDTNKVELAENKTGIQLPDDIEAANLLCGNDDFTFWETYIKINTIEEQEKFAKQMEENSLWVDSIAPYIKEICQPFTSGFYGYDYYLFYNVTAEEYNTRPTIDESECILIAYDIELGKIYIISDLKVSV